MKLKYLVSFDPEIVAPKDVKAALVNAGLEPDDIRLQATREPAAPKSSAKPKAVKPSA